MLPGHGHGHAKLPVWLPSSLLLFIVTNYDMHCVGNINAVSQRLDWHLPDLTKNKRATAIRPAAADRMNFQCSQGPEMVVSLTEPSDRGGRYQAYIAGTSFRVLP